MSFNCWAYLAFLPSGPEWLYIGVLFVLLFGADKLPQFARGLGRTLGEFKRAKEEMEEELRRATQEDTRPRIRPRADGDDDAMPPSPKTLPVTNESSATALPAPEEGVTSSTVAASAAAEPVTAASATTTAAAVTATAVTPILRPVATAVAFGSARRAESAVTASVESAAPSAPAPEDDDFDMPTTQMDESGQPIAPFVAGQPPAATTEAEKRDKPSEEDDANRRPSSFVL